MYTCSVFFIPADNKANDSQEPNAVDSPTAAQPVVVKKSGVTIIKPVLTKKRQLYKKVELSKSSPIKGLFFFSVLVLKLYTHHVLVVRVLFHAIMDIIILSAHEYFII